MNVVYSKKTREDIDRYIASPSHALIMVAPVGYGKAHIAHDIAKQLLGAQQTEASLYIVRPNEKLSITIEDARTMAHFVKLKAPSSAPRRVMIIEDAHYMTSEAQNAILKLLEEPPQDVFFILTTISKQGLQNTVLSRSHIVELAPHSKKEGKQLFAGLHSESDIERAWHISGGRIGLMQAILGNNSHELLTAIEVAKDILAAKTYTKLTNIDKASQLPTPLLMEALQTVSDAAFKQAVIKQNQKLITHWQGIRQTIYQAKSTLGANPNQKLLLTNLMLNV